MAAGDLSIEQVMGKLKIDPCVNLKRADKKQHGNGSSSDANGSVGESELDFEPLAVPHSPTNYYEYYYPGYQGFPGGSNSQGFYLNGDGLEMQYPVMIVDNGSPVSFMPGFQLSYNPYTYYLPMATIDADGQYAIAQQPSSLSPVFSPSDASSFYYPTHVPCESDLVSSYYMTDTSYLAEAGVYSNVHKKVSKTPSNKPCLSASGYTRAPSKSNSEFRNYSACNQFKESSKPANGSSLRPDSVRTNGRFPFTKFPSYYQSEAEFLHQNRSINLKAKGRSLIDYDSPKAFSKSNAISDLGLNNGPRTTRNAFVSTDDTVASLDADKKKNNCSSTGVDLREQFNLPDFPTKYNNAFFFVIKSYSEDDIHKSIKYNVWTSTPNGNKKLNSVYQETQKKMEGNVSPSPVFLFFSVNASGQFCGIAEMTGRVNFNESMDFWQQDKWNGYFPVKWHIIKDVPNPQLRHIILENNEHKPVINSRDTQEVRLPQGIEMLSIFKNYVSKTSILDDFEFYENRQKMMQEKRVGSSIICLDAVQV